MTTSAWIGALVLALGTYAMRWGGMMLGRTGFRPSDRVLAGLTAAVLSAVIVGSLSDAGGKTESIAVLVGVIAGVSVRRLGASVSLTLVVAATANVIVRFFLREV